MGYISVQTLDSIAADIEAAVVEIGRKYGMEISYSGVKPQDFDWPTEDGIIFNVSPLHEDEISDEARNSDFWKAMLAEGSDD